MEPIDGSYINVLASFLDANTDPMESAGALTNTDMAFLLNIPTQQLSALRTAPSSADVIDRRVQRGTSKEHAQRKRGQSLKCIRPNHAILIRLFLKYPEYATLIPPRPSSSEVYDIIQPFMRMPGQPLNDPDANKRRWFAQLFGRSLIISYKMLSSDPTVLANRNNSRPVTHLQTLVMLRFGEEFRNLYTQYRDRFLPVHEQRNPLYSPISRSWDILRERDSLTDWMDDDLYEAFEADLTKRWCAWWDNKFMETLRHEAESRDIDFEEVLKTGNWQTKDEVTNLKNYTQENIPITGADGSLLTSFRGFTGLSSSEALWLLGISPKTFFMYRSRPTQRVDAAVSILMRHLYHNPADLELFIKIPESPLKLLQKIQEIDPAFERKQLGVLFGGGAIAGYNMTRQDAMVPAFARRAASLMTQHFRFSTSIYWHLRECAEAEATARGLDPRKLWDEAKWHPNDPDQEGDSESDQGGEGDDLDE